jgi:hypothetical protein
MRSLKIFKSIDRKKMNNKTCIYTLILSNIFLLLSISSRGYNYIIYHVFILIGIIKMNGL